MRMDYVLAIMGAIKMLQSVPKGEMRRNLAIVVLWSCVPRMTCYRYLNQLEELGLVEAHIGEYRGKECKMYSLTTEGMKFWRKEKIRD